MHAVITQKMCIGFDRAKIVDCDDLNVGAARFHDSAEDVTANAAKAVDCDANCHFS